MGVEIVAAAMVLVVLIVSVATVRIVRSITEAGPDVNVKALRVVVRLAKVLFGRK